MAKSKAKAVKVEKPKDQQKAVVKLAGAKPDKGVLPWVAPFPEAKLDENGIDMVHVRVIPTQDIRINGHLMAAGVERTIPCSIAHAHAAALSGPKEK